MLKIGKINYANLFPLYYYLERESDHLEFDFTAGVPSEINNLLRKGEIDIAPCSSIEYLRRKNNYSLINGHSVSSTGPILSILLFSKVSIEELNNKKILISSHSETAAALLKIVLNRFFKIKPHYSISSAGLNEALAKNSAYLLIGDNALTEYISLEDSNKNRRNALYVYDLGEIWDERTQLPFVYALWIARKDITDEPEYKSFISLLDSAKDKAINNLQHLSSTCNYNKGFTPELLNSYWQLISYDLSENQLKGLDAFEGYLNELNLF